MVGILASKRDDILAVSLHLFKRHGFNNIGVDQLIKDSKVAKMTFYKYFPSKLKLVQACLEFELQTINLELDIFLKSKATDNVKEELNNLLLFFYNYSKKPDYNGCLFSTACSEINEFSIFARKVKIGEGKKQIQPIVDKYNSWLSNLISDILEKYSLINSSHINLIVMSLIDEILSSNSKIKSFSQIRFILDEIKSINI